MKSNTSTASIDYKVESSYNSLTSLCEVNTVFNHINDIMKQVKLWYMSHNTYGNVVILVLSIHSK